MVLKIDVITASPPVESEEVALVVIVDCADEEVDVIVERLEAIVLVAALVVGGTDDGAVGVLVIEVTVLPSGTSMTSLLSQLQQSSFVGSLFLSQHQLPSEHSTTASFPAAVLFEVQYCGQSSPLNTSC